MFRLIEVGDLVFYIAGLFGDPNLHMAKLQIRPGCEKAILKNFVKMRGCNDLGGFFKIQ